MMHDEWKLCNWWGSLNFKAYKLKLWNIVLYHELNSCYFIVYTYLPQNKRSNRNKWIVNNKKLFLVACPHMLRYPHTNILCVLQSEEVKNVFLFNQTAAHNQTHRILSITSGAIGEFSVSVQLHVLPIELHCFSFKPNGSAQPDTSNPFHYERCNWWVFCI